MPWWTVARQDVQQRERLHAAQAIVKPNLDEVATRGEVAVSGEHWDSELLRSLATFSATFAEALITGPKAFSVLDSDFGQPFTGGVERGSEDRQRWPESAPVDPPGCHHAARHWSGCASLAGCASTVSCGS